jgi:hypothetical protein
MHLIEVTPQPCMICGTGNTPTNDGSRRQFIDLERDTFWDDPAIICEDCALRIAGLVGAPSPEEIQQAKAEVRRLKTSLHEARTELDANKRRAKKLGIQFVDEDQEAVA